MKRAPLDVSGGRPPTSEEFSLALGIVDRSRLVHELDPHLAATTGRHRHLPLKALLVALQINALGRRHQALLINAARTINSLNAHQLETLGISNWEPAHAYRRVQWLYARLCRLLDTGEAGIDADSFANRLANAAIPNRYRHSPALAVDGTDIETWGAFQGSIDSVELDGHDPPDGPDEPAPAITAPKRRPSRRTRRARVIAVGPDGRNQYTPDPDARAGRRSANGSNAAGPYLGYELHLAVQTRCLRWTNYIDRATLGPEVPNVITTVALRPAGSHRSKSIVPALLAAKAAGQDIREILWDPGYSLNSPETAVHPLHQAGIEITFQPAAHQRTISPFSPHALLVDGQLYSTLLPVELRDLKMPPIRAKGNYRRAYEEPFNQRARWRLVRHQSPDAGGVTRWKCPFCAGLLRSRTFPKTMRRSNTTPLVFLPDGVSRCCNGTVSAPPADLPHTQRIPFGTTAWRTSMNRRMAVESVNSALKGGYVDTSRGYFRLFGLTKITVLFAFTIAAVNLDRIRSHQAKQEPDDQPKNRRPRRPGTWRQLLTELSKPEPQDNSPPG